MRESSCCRFVVAVVAVGEGEGEGKEKRNGKKDQQGKVVKNFQELLRNSTASLLERVDLGTKPGEHM